MKKYAVLFFFLASFIYSECKAQYYNYGRGRRIPNGIERENLPDVKPALYLSFGYGYPNLDKMDLLQFYNFYRGSGSQSGPVFGAVDYQFNRSTSLGVMVSYGKVSAPYFNNSGTSTDPPSFYGHLESWSAMFNIIRYMPAGNIVHPYLKTAIGINFWNQSYVDAAGNKVIQAEKPNMLAYQASFGARFSVSGHAGLFMEAGYGKYILAGGLSFKF